LKQNYEMLANTSPLSTRARARAREAAGNQRPWPADKVERWSIDRLIPYAKNARTHTDAQVAAIAASIREWGWTTPALVGEDAINGTTQRIATGTVIKPIGANGHPDYQRQKILLGDVAAINF
jgi:hypothetical protein